jgi:hypothetical protein
MMPGEAHHDDLRRAAPPEHAEVATSRRGVAIGILRFAIAAAILVYLFRSVPVSNVRAILGRADPAWVTAAFLLALLTQVIMAMRLRILTDAYALSLTTFDVFEINLATRFYGLFLPGGGVTATPCAKLACLRKNHGGASRRLCGPCSRTLAMCCVGVARFHGMVLTVELAADMAIAMLALATCSSGCSARNRSGAPENRLSPAESSSRSEDHGGDPADPAKWIRVLDGPGARARHGRIPGAARSLDVEPDSPPLWIRAAMLFATLVPITISGLGEGAAVLLLRLRCPSDVAPALAPVFSVSHLRLGWWVSARSGIAATAPQP